MTPLQTETSEKKNAALGSKYHHSFIEQQRLKL